MDLSLVISIVALAASSVSPFASAWLNGHYRMKEKRLDLQAAEQRHRWEFFEQHRAEVIEHYLDTVGRWLLYHSAKATSELGGAAGEIYLYVDESLWPILDAIASGMKDTPTEQMHRQYRELCKALVHYDVRAKDEPQPGNAKARKI